MIILPWFIECPKVARDSKPKIFIIVSFNSVSCVQLKTGDYKLSCEGECSPISCDHYKCSHTQPLLGLRGHCNTWIFYLYVYCICGFIMCLHILRWLFFLIKSLHGHVLRRGWTRGDVVFFVTREFHHLLNANDKLQIRLKYHLKFNSCLFYSE